MKNYVAPELEKLPLNPVDIIMTTSSLEPEELDPEENETPIL